MKEQTIAVSISLGYLSYISMRIDTVYKIRRKYKGALEIQRNSVQIHFGIGPLGLFKSDQFSIKLAWNSHLKNAHC